MRKILLVIGIAVFVGLTYLLLKNYLIINKISCFNQYGQCSAELSNELETFVGEGYLDVRPGISKQLSSDNRIDNYSIQFKLLDTFVVKVIEQKANFALKANDDVFILVSDDGEVVEIVESSSLPHVTVENFTGGIGDNVNSEQLFALNLIKELFFAYKIDSAELTNEAIEVKQKNETIVLFPKQGDIEVLLGALELINSRLKLGDKEFRIELGQGITQVDLRYKNPVIK